MKRIISGKSGFTLVEIMIVVAIIGLLAAIAVPNFVHARSVSHQTVCINNLRLIQDAMSQWAMENKKLPGATVGYTDIQDYLRRSVVCPSGGTTFDNSYTLTDTASPPVCKNVPSGPGAHLLPP